MFKLALVQMRVEPGEKASNLKHAAELVAEAARSGAQLVVLTEALTVGSTDSLISSHADAIPDGDSVQQLSELARRYQIHLCAGLVERSGQQIFNAAVLLSPNGELLLHHRKIFELDIAHDCYALG